MTRRLFICGAGNPEGVRLALRVNERTRRWRDISILDDDPQRLGARQLGIAVAGPFELLAAADPAEAETVNLVARTSRGRRAARSRIAAFGVPWARLISHDVDLLGTEVGDDLIAYQHATLGPETHIGEGVVVFMSATVGHESTVGDHCVIAANAILNARVRLGEGVYVGSNAVILPEIHVGEHATIGAGAIVIEDVPAGATVFAGTSETVSMSVTASAAGLSAEDTAAVLHRLWCEVLHLNSVPRSRNFFDLGGTSLMALRLTKQIEAATGCPVSAVEFFHYPTIEAMCTHLTAASVADDAVSIVAQRRASVRNGLMQQATLSARRSNE